LERIRQTIAYSALKHKSELESLDPKIQCQLSNLNNTLIESLDELQKLSETCLSTKDLIMPLGESCLTNNNSINSRSLQLKLIEQNRVLLNTIKKMNEDSNEQKLYIKRLDEEIRHRKHKEANLLNEHDKEKVINFLCIRYLSV
jgi:hypothetical protein